MLDSQTAPDKLPTKALFEAIARNICVETTYNHTVLTLAPHILYTRHDDLFVDAVTVQRDGNKPKEVKLGTFKLAGLSDVALSTRGFSPYPDFDPHNPKYADSTVFAIET